MKTISDYKKLKKVKLIYEDLTTAHSRLSTSIELLKEYTKYSPVMESLSVLHNSRTLIEIHLKKCKKILDDKVD